MMLLENLPGLIERTTGLARVLDVGGAWQPLNTATHLIDAQPWESMLSPVIPDAPCRYSRTSYLQLDMCSKPWPFPDGFFDFAHCSHTLEDVRDPVGVCEEMMRVAAAGYIEVPSRLRESFHYKGGYFWRRVIGRPIRVGFGHHRWLCERESDGLVFVAKTNTIMHSRHHFITRAELGRDLTIEEAAIGFYWTRRFSVRERLIIVPGETEADYIAFKQRTLAALRTAARG